MGNQLDTIVDWPERARAADWKVNGLAKNCGVSPRTLERFLQNRMGKSAKEWMTFHRLQAAHDSLRNGLTVKETAAAVGYASQHQFSRAFKKFHSHSPSEVPPEGKA